MRNFLFLPFLFLASASFGQTASKSAPFPGEYAVEGYLLQEDTLELTLLIDEADLAYIDVLTFSDNNTVAHRMIMPKDMMICGNGLLYLDNSSFRFRKNREVLILALKGGHMVQDQFSYKAKYRVEKLSDTSMLLIRKKVRRFDQKSEWADNPRLPATSAQERTPSGFAANAY